MSEENEKDLERTKELFAFLQGETPKDHKIRPGHLPKLTADQAWTVIWYLGNQYWQVMDRVEQCCVCGAIYHTWEEGYCLDYGKAPYSFCGNCTEGEKFAKKMRRNPDKQARKNFFAR